MKLVLIAGLGGAIGSTLASTLAHGDSDETHWGMMTYGPRFKSLNLKLTPFDDIKLSGWDLQQENLFIRAKSHGCIPLESLIKVSTSLSCTIPRVGLQPNNTDIATWFATELAWVNNLRKIHDIHQVVLVNLCPTAPIAPDTEINWEDLSSLSWENPAVTVDRLYFRFAIEAGAHFINFTPNFCEINKLTALAIARKLAHSGRDGKTGQTFLKTLLAPALRDKNFRVDGWFSTNILGNADGATLSDQSNAATKIASKRECLSEMLGYAPGGALANHSHQVHIHYYPPRGDAKEAWDNIDFSGIFGLGMQLKVNWLGRDSILAAPAVLDLIQLTLIADQAGQTGLLEALGYFYKTPLVMSERSMLHDIDQQYAKLLKWASSLAPTLKYDKFGWPVWPQGEEDMVNHASEIIRHGPWAISGEKKTHKTQEQYFANEFSEFIGSPYAVACSSGSSGLQMALEAAGVGYGDRVLVPSTPWVACASAIVAVGGIPVFCDLETGGLCISAQEAQLFIDDNIKAIILVHAYCSIGDINSFLELTHKYSIPLIEDCSQAHGATWNGKKVGSYGDFSVFSMQESKILTSGEGGVVLCKTQDNYEKLQELRADGRVWEGKTNEFSYLSSGLMTQGYNRCLSEMQSGLLRAGLKKLLQQNKTRQENALYLNEALVRELGISSHFKWSQLSQPVIYKLCISLPKNHTNINEIARNVSAYLKAPVHPFLSPIYRHDLYRPQLVRRFPDSHVNELKRATEIIHPEAEYRASNTICFPHRLFMGKQSDMNRILHAIIKETK